MNIAGHLGAWLAAPLMLTSSFFGGSHALPANYQPNNTAPAYQAQVQQPAAAAPANAGNAGWGGWWWHQPTTTPGTDVSISSISPESGDVGTRVTLYGGGFTADSIVHFGAGAIQSPAISNDGAQISFAVPTSIGPYCGAGVACPQWLQLVTPGAYQIYVSDENGTSNSVSFTVDGSTVSSSAPTITDVDGPATLGVNKTGTWTVDANSSASGNLSYSVDWGDEGTANADLARAAVTQSSATFTHQYAAAGTYHPVFTVTDSQGRTDTQRETVVVGTVAASSVSVNGISAPTTLKAGKAGTWTVNVASTGKGNLTYSADWGDEGTANADLARAAVTQSSSTFTHTYATAGTYHPTFTVTDNAGHSATVSASVIVTKKKK